MQRSCPPISRFVFAGMTFALGAGYTYANFGMVGDQKWCLAGQGMRLATDHPSYQHLPIQRT